MWVKFCVILPWPLILKMIPPPLCMLVRTAIIESLHSIVHCFISSLYTKVTTWTTNIMKLFTWQWNSKLGKYIHSTAIVTEIAIIGLFWVAICCYECTGGYYSMLILILTSHFPDQYSVFSYIWMTTYFTNIFMANIAERLMHAHTRSNSLVFLSFAAWVCIWGYMTDAFR